MPAPPHRLYAIRYATNGTRLESENLSWIAPHGDCPHDRTMPIDFFVWAAVRGREVTLVDSGSDAATCRSRGNEFLQSPADGLARIGVDATDVRHVVTTHLHWDHCGNLAAFPNARLHVQRTEVAHACGPAMGSPFLRRAFDVDQVAAYVRAIYDGRVTFHDGPEEVVPGLSLHPVGGHTPGMQAVRVVTERGAVVLASDAAHFFRNLEEENPFPILVDVVQYVEGLRSLSALAGSREYLVPGHDPAVLSMYPAAGPDTEGAVVRLDVEPAERPVEATHP